MMSQVRRLLVIAGLWELAMGWATSFIGAWFWHLHTPLSAIVLYYLLWFLVMGLVFGWGATTARRLAYQRLRGMGIVVALIYMGLLAVLGPASRHVSWLVAILTGLSSGFYWVSLYVGGAASVSSEQAAWYNAWIGILENVFAIAGPPVAAGIIVAFASGVGYRVVFGLAMTVLAVALILGSGSARHPAMAVATEPPPQKALQHVRWSMAALGLRDGLLFFIPGLYLFMVTRNPLWSAGICPFRPVFRRFRFGYSQGEVRNPCTDGMRLSCPSPPEVFLSCRPLFSACLR